MDMMTAYNAPVIYVSENDIDDYREKLPGSYYSLMFISEGLLICTINGSKCQYGQGDLIFFRKSDDVSFLQRDGSVLSIYALAFSEEVMRDFKLFFSGDFFDRFLANPMPACIKLHGIQRDKLEREFRQLKTTVAIEKQNAESTLRLFAANTVYAFFISRMEIPAWIETPPNWFVDYYMLLSRHYVFTKPFADIIALSGKSREYISRLFKSSTGINISDYIISQRMGYACNLLKNSNMAVMEISFECGFDNLSTFYHHFTQRVGTSPQKYRNITRTL